MWVEVAYALSDKQTVLRVEVQEGCTLHEAVVCSGITELYPDLDLSKASMGIFGRLVRAPREEPVQEGDRVEIYRPLLIDPKQARLNRAQQQGK